MFAKLKRCIERGPSITSLARVMYQKVISARILKFLRETSSKKRRNYGMEKWTCPGAHRANCADTLLFHVPSLVHALSRRNRKSIRPPTGTTDVDVIRGKSAQRRETNGHNDRTIQLLRIHRRPGARRLPADNFHLCQVSARATFSRCSTQTIRRINRNSREASPSTSERAHARVKTASYNDGTEKIQTKIVHRNM